MIRIWNSLRWRIVAYYTSLLAVAISLMLALGHRTQTRHLSQLAAARMQAAGLSVLPFFFPLPSGRGPGTSLRPRRLENPEFLGQLRAIHANGMVVLAIESNGNKVFASPNLPDEFLPPAKQFTDEQVHAIEYAAHLVTELKARGGDRLVLAITMKHLRDQAQDSLMVSIAIGATVFVILALIGMLLVFGGLRPITRMSSDARRIADGDLSARLDPASQSEELRGLLSGSVL